MVKLGIAGIGAIAENYIALIADGRVEGVELTALCSRNGEHARQTASKYHLPVAVFTDYSAFLESGVVDAVLIATPHGQHPSMTRQALEQRASMCWWKNRWESLRTRWREYWLY